MNFQQHLKAGILGGIATTLAFSAATKKPDELAAVFGLTVAGSLFSDLDTDSKPSKIVSMVLFIAGIAAIYSREPYLCLYAMTAFCFIKSTRHRGISHSYFVPAACFWLTYLTKSPYFIPLGFGVVIHLLVDQLYPWKFKNWFNFSLPRLVK